MAAKIGEYTGTLAPHRVVPERSVRDPVFSRSGFDGSSRSAAISRTVFTPAPVGTAEPRPPLPGPALRGRGQTGDLLLLLLGRKPVQTVCNSPWRFRRKSIVARHSHFLLTKVFGLIFVFLPTKEVNCVLTKIQARYPHGKGGGHFYKRCPPTSATARRP